MIEQLLDNVLNFPQSYVAVSDRIRWEAMRDFPYNVYYAIYPGEIMIISIGHQHHHPKHWKSRLKDIHE